MPNNYARDQEHEGLSPALTAGLPPTVRPELPRDSRSLGDPPLHVGALGAGRGYVRSSWKMLRLALSQLYRELKNEQKTQENNRADHQHSSTAYSGSPR
jgi:50S ribosomal subunit-associated GTPase HflX